MAFDKLKPSKRWSGADGGYIMDASAIMQNDATLENLKAMTDATIEYGVYRSVSSPSPMTPVNGSTPGLPEWVTQPRVQPGTCFAWEDKIRDLAPVCGDGELICGGCRSDWSAWRRLVC